MIDSRWDKFPVNVSGPRAVDFIKANYEAFICKSGEALEEKIDLYQAIRVYQVYNMEILINSDSIQAKQ